MEDHLSQSLDSFRPDPEDSLDILLSDIPIKTEPTYPTNESINDPAHNKALD